MNCDGSCVFQDKCMLYYWNTWGTRKPFVITPRFIITIGMIRKVRIFSKQDQGEYQGEINLDVFFAFKDICMLHFLESSEHKEAV